LQNNTETWLYLLKHTFELHTCPPEIKGKVFKRFLEIAEVKHLTSTEMETYQRSLKRSHLMRDIAHCAKMEGLSEGKTMGLLEGKTMGLLEGKMEERIQLAIKLLKRNMPIEDIISLTELSGEQMKGLLN